MKIQDNFFFKLFFCLRYTCDECIKGLEWVEAYIEDPIMIAEFTIYLEQNYCLSKSFFKFQMAFLFLLKNLFPSSRRLGRLQAACGGALPQHAHDGHGEVLHTYRDLHE